MRTDDQIRASVDATPKVRPNGSLNGHAALPPEVLEPCEIGDFLTLEIAPRKMLLAPIIPSQGLVMLYAPRGKGKTFVALNIAHAAATGGSFLGWKAEAPCRVLLIDGEMPAVTLQERLRSIAPDRKPERGYFRILAADLHRDGLPDLASTAGQEAVDAVLGETQLLVLDNLSSLIRSAAENEADAWQGVQDWLLRLRRRGVSVLIVHHAGKGGSQRGTSRREDVLDTIVALRQPGDYQARDGARFEVHIEKARGVAGADLDPFEAKMELRDGVQIWSTKPLEDARYERASEMYQERMTVKEVSEELGVSTRTAKRMQRRAANEGKIPEPRKGRPPKAGTSAPPHFYGNTRDDE